MNSYNPRKHRPGNGIEKLLRSCIYIAGLMVFLIIVLFISYGIQHSNDSPSDQSNTDTSVEGTR